MSDTSAKELLKKANSQLKKIEALLGVQVITLILNPYQEGLKPYRKGTRDDSWYLNAVIENAGLSRCTLILNGQGGDFYQGIKLARTLRRSLEGYKVIVPRLCCSALCLPCLKADQLDVATDADITQIDPQYYTQNDDDFLRAVDESQHPKDARRLRAKQIMSHCKEIVMELIREKPSLYNHKVDEWEESYDAETIAERFMRKPTHDSPVSVDELKGMNLKVKEFTESTNLMVGYIQPAKSY